MKNCFMRIGIPVLVLIIAYTAIRPYLGANLRSENFPLREKWSTRLQGDIQQLTVADETTLIARTNVAMYAVDIPTGSIRWRRWTEWKIPESPVMVMEGRLFFTDGEYAWALRLADGEVLWQQKIQHPESAEVVDVSQNVVAVRDGGRLSLQNVESGALLWSDYVCRNYSVAYIDEPNVYIPCYGIIAVDIKTGEIVWEIESNFLRRVAFTDSLAYYLPDSDSVTAFDLVKQKQVWNVSLSHGNASRLRVNEEHLFLADNDRVCALQRSSGSILWCSQNIPVAQNGAVLGKRVYVLNGLLNEITALDLGTGETIGQLIRPTFVLGRVDVVRQMMVSTGELLIFGSVKHLFAYGE